MLKSAKVSSAVKSCAPRLVNQCEGLEIDHGPRPHWDDEYTGRSAQQDCPRGAVQELPSGSVSRIPLAAAILVAVGSNPERLQSEAAFASLCGVSTKIHLVADARGRPMRFSITGGQRADVSQVIPLLSGIEAGAVIADKG